MVDYTEPICQLIDSSLASMLTFDTSGIELYVSENNPKTLNSLISRLKSYYKDNPDIDPYKLAYGLMPSKAASCPDAKQQYINGHFCYADKFVMLTNGLGIVRHIAFLDDDLKALHPEMPVEKKSDSPDEDKSIGDSSSLKPILSDFFQLHPHFHPDTFLGDSAFDTIEIYGFLKDEFHFSKALIPYNPRNESTLKKVGYNEYGYPTCPEDPSLAMKYLGITREKGRADRIKWGCPKMRYEKGAWICDCKKPCSTAKKGAPLIPMKIWISVCFPVFSETRRNGLLFTRSGPLSNEPSIILKPTCAFPEEKPGTMPPQRQMSFWPALPANLR